MPIVGEHIGYSPGNLRRDRNALRQETRDANLRGHFAELEQELQTVLAQPVESVSPTDITEVNRWISDLAKWKERLGRRGPHLPFFPEELAEKYEDISYVAEGGFARVYRATAQDGRIVAIKIPKEIDSSTGRLFLNEIANWDLLNHRNVVKLYDKNIYPCPYLELEWVEGGTLQEVSKPLPVQDAAKMILGISNALHHSHNREIMHRDIKPGNVLLASDGEPKVTDWGLSQVKTRTDRRSLNQRYTLMYAAPEQLSQTHGAIDEKTDVFQLGAVFYELATGEVPFPGHSEAEVVGGILNQEPQKPSELNPEVSPVEGIILGCLVKRKEDRYSLARLRENLLDYLGEEHQREFMTHSRTGDRRRARFLCSELVMITARQNNTKECLAKLDMLKGYVEGSELRASLESVGEQLELYVRLNKDLDEVIVDALDREVHRIKTL